MAETEEQIKDEVKMDTTPEEGSRDVTQMTESLTTEIQPSEDSHTGSKEYKTEKEV